MCKQSHSHDRPLMMRKIVRGAADGKQQVLKPMEGQHFQQISVVRLYAMQIPSFCLYFDLAENTLHRYKLHNPSAMGERTGEKHISECVQLRLHSEEIREFGSTRSDSGEDASAGCGSGEKVEEAKESIARKAKATKG